MKPKVRTILGAHAALVEMYRAVFPLLTENLRAAHSIHLKHTAPLAVPREPYDIAEGIEYIRSQVRISGILNVSDLHDTTLYGRDGNAWFRTVHDAVHLLYGLGFTYRHEMQVHKHLWALLTQTSQWWGLDGPQQALVKAIYWADTFAQTKYERRTGRFPEDQGAFVINYVQRSLRHATA